MNLRTPAMRKGLLPAAIVFALAPVAAHAQDQATQGAGTTELDRIQVTGSRIRSVETETAQPVFVMNRQQIEEQGFQSVSDILQNISSAGSPAFSRSSVLASNESAGGSYIDMRNLGPSRTLILLDGKRLGINAEGLQDVASIPSSIVERIEVLKDGASTLYGSDAVAGVVNIITRKNFDGAEGNVYFGQNTQGDGAITSGDFTIGSTSERSSLLFSAQYSKEDPVWAKDRAYSRTGSGPFHPTAGRSVVSQYGTISNLIIGTDDDGDPIYGDLMTLDRGGDSRNFADYHVTDDNDLANSNEQMMLKSGMERRSIYTQGRFDFTDNVSFVADALYNHRETEVQVAGYPFQSAAWTDVAPTNLDIDSYYNPLGNQSSHATPQEVEFFRRGWEVPRVTNNKLTTYRFSAAFEGAFEVGERFFDWSVGYMYNKNEGSKVGYGDFNLINTAQALGPSFLNADGVVQCGTPDNPIALGTSPGQCTPWNPLSNFGDAGPNTLADPNVQNFLFARNQSLSESETQVFSADISGSIVQLPAGPLGFAAGLEHRKESAMYSPDAMMQNGTTTSNAAGLTQGQYSLDEAYLELNVPLLSDLPGAQELTINVAGRYSDYDTFGDTTNLKGGFTWRPIDQLLVRGNYGEGFRAPVIGDLYGGLSGTYTYYTDPCDTTFGNAVVNPATAARCAADPNIPAGYRQVVQGGGLATQPGQQSNAMYMVGANPDLLPETAVTKTLGLVWSPEFVDGLDISLDWWNVRIENAIRSDALTLILDDCYQRGIESRCDFFTRDATGEIVDAQWGMLNSGWLETEGYDLEVNYRLRETSFGDFGANWQTTYTSYLNEQVDDTGENPTQVYTGFGGNFRIRSNLQLTWDYGDFGATWGMRYFSSIKENCAYDQTGGPECNLPNHIAPDTGAQPLNQTGSNTFNDVQIRYRAPWNATISLGANNVFNREGQVLYSQPNSQYSYYGGFDIGRFVYMKYQQRF
ncbi:TonB-dependent receptor [Luteimonas sp. BDR2-5]|uniref:TonB-dependent receptor plug domain-containing protein n=1 Tax=Proluteimonas luteida TaxID=2878685 RepID=UPI001E2BA7F6|nr:TonB-dependent receptor [Luteimonas sp. BDR2-5]MCD9029670.1 TonB-dependent receptor [Luteimonas sp. BDR2-5]